jgi:hypothetical protein
VTVLSKIGLKGFEENIMEIWNVNRQCKLCCFIFEKCKLCSCDLICNSVYEVNEIHETWQQCVLRSINPVPASFLPSGAVTRAIAGATFAFLNWFPSGWRTTGCTRLLVGECCSSNSARDCATSRNEGGAEPMMRGTHY